MTRKRCQTGWVRYPDKVSADIALARAKAQQALRKKSPRREQRAYSCDFCKGWHLTAEDKHRPGEVQQ